MSRRTSLTAEQVAAVRAAVRGWPPWSPEQREAIRRALGWHRRVVSQQAIENRLDHQPQPDAASRLRLVPAAERSQWRLTVTQAFTDGAA